MKMAGKQTKPAKTNLNPLRGGLLVPSVTWYNMHYWMVNGFLLGNSQWMALTELVPWKYANFGDALREAVKLLLLENTQWLAACNKTGASKLTMMKNILATDRTEDMKPDEVGRFKLELLEEMYKKLQREEK